MNTQKPENMKEYLKWLRKTHGVRISRRTEIYYESVTSKVKLDFEKSVFWRELTENLAHFDSEYLLQTGYNLLTNSRPELCAKPFKSFLLKTFRKNILENERWPDEPEGGWILPSRRGQPA